MNYLLDTHILIWYFAGDKRLPIKIQEIINNDENHIYYSIVSPWELEIKHLKNKNFKATGKQLSFLCEQNYIDILPVNNEHINNLSEVDKLCNIADHNDPFDKMLISQAITDNLVLITHDKKMKGYQTKFIKYI